MRIARSPVRFAPAEVSASHPNTDEAPFLLGAACAPANEVCRTANSAYAILILIIRNSYRVMLLIWEYMSSAALITFEFDSYARCASTICTNSVTT